MGYDGMFLNLINYPVGFEVYLSIFKDAQTLQFRRIMPAFRIVSERIAFFLYTRQDAFCFFKRVVSCNVKVDFFGILFSINR